MRHLFAAVAMALLALPTFGKDAGKSKAPEELRELNLSLVEKLSPSFVKVNYYIKVDETGAHCSIARSWRNNSAQYIDLKKPYSAPGFVISPNTIISDDPKIPTENIDRIEIETADGKTSPAKIVEYFTSRDAIKLTLSASLPVKPLTFTNPEKLPDELFSFSIDDIGGAITATTKSFSPTSIIHYMPSGEDFLKLPTSSLIVDDKSNVLAITFRGELEMAQNWRLPPDKWQGISAAAKKIEHQNILNIAKNGIFPVKFKLAEPPKNASRNNHYIRREENEVECIAPGLLMPDDTLLVPLRLSAADCARIEHITVAVNGKIIPADYVGAVKEYDLFVIKPQEKITGQPIKFAEVTTDNYYHSYAWKMKLDISENAVIAKVIPAKASPGELERGYQNQRFLEDSSGLGFSADGQLIYVPIMFRAMRDSRYSNGPKPFSIIARELTHKIKDFDATYAPKPPDDRFKIGWLGIDYQQLTPDLAEASDLMSATNGGRIGMLVTDVMADSPAQKAGLKLDDVLLRITPEATGIPVELEGYEFDRDDMFDFPWGEYDGLSEEDFDWIPYPWHNLNSGIDKLVSDFGIGSTYKIEYVSDGKIKDVTLKVEPAPECFYNAKRMNVKELGITVCNMTGEVRNYMRMTPEDPAVLIAAVKAGTKASVAGIKPYEMIVKVGDTPVHNIDEFKAATEGKTELRLEIKRLSVSRIVNVKLDGPLTYEEK